MSDLATHSIMYLPGVGPKKAEVLKTELKITSYEDLLYHFPYKYVDRSRFYAIREITGDMPYIQVRGKLASLKMVGEGRGKRMTGTFFDETGTLELVWFKGLKYLKEQLKPNETYILFGKPSLFNHTINVVHPEMEKEQNEKAAFFRGLQPSYHTTEKMKNNYLTSRTIFKLVQNVLQTYTSPIPETLPAHIIETMKLMQLTKALHYVHMSPDAQTLQKATFRLKFEELFYIQLNILRLRNQRTYNLKGHVFEKVGTYFNQFYTQNLPFELTNAQKRVIKEMRKDMGSGRQMNRLLQGDVGSGKTLVALMIMLIAIDNGYQACLMAPTEILASQHYETLTEMLKGISVDIGLLKGSTKKSEREALHTKLQDGSLKIIVGTHALIEDTVRFSNLGLVVVDEQHRFGVAQRARLWKKNLAPPHVMVMTATPIPRTLAMTIYGDLDVSVIDELPPGRKAIQTSHAYHNKRLGLNKFVKSQIESGRQIYVVYPLIEESEKMDFKNLSDGFEYMKEVFPNYKVSMVHGKMKPAEKDAAMLEFASGESQILVATTVIEVGVNIPNASVMIIESAERFGLSQLHQLRGRVGRGADQSYCVLMTGYKLTQESRKRIETMTRTNDGFEIAEADMKLRGPGDMEGTQQSGLPFELRIADLGKDGRILQMARNMAQNILSADPLLQKHENNILQRQLKKLAQQKMNWAMIS
jgi:ATP-dependent DNA helicase RecG